MLKKPKIKNIATEDIFWIFETEREKIGTTENVPVFFEPTFAKGCTTLLVGDAIVGYACQRWNPEPDKIFKGNYLEVIDE